MYKRQDVGIGLVRHPLAEAGRHEPLRDGGAQRHGMSLPERARGCLLYTSFDQRVDTHQFAVRIDQRTARIARVHRGIGLD